MIKGKYYSFQSNHFIFYFLIYLYKIEQWVCCLLILKNTFLIRHLKLLFMNNINSWCTIRCTQFKKNWTKSLSINFDVYDINAEIHLRFDVGADKCYFFAFCSKNTLFVIQQRFRYIPSGVPSKINVSFLFSCSSAHLCTE